MPEMAKAVKMSDDATRTIEFAELMRVAPFDFDPAPESGEAADDPGSRGEVPDGPGASAAEGPMLIGTPRTAQVLTGGASIWQIFGSARARSLSTLMPYDSAAPASSSHRQMGFDSISPASSGQHGLSGLLELLPVSTYVKQSVRLNSALTHSELTDDAGDGAIVICAFVTYANMTVKNTMIIKIVLSEF